MNTLNKTQAKELFEKEAIFFGENDGIPLYRAIELLGKNAVEFAINKNNPKYTLTCNIFSVPINNSVEYLTFSGFLQAVTYNNIIYCNENQKFFKNKKKS